MSFELNLNTFEVLLKVYKMVEVLFKDGRIQVGDRVKIPKAVMDTLELEAGDEILIKFDPIKRRIVIEEDESL